MLKKTDGTVVSSADELKLEEQFDLSTIMSQLPPIPVHFFGLRMEQYRWYEKTILAMLQAKEIKYDLHELCSVFYAIRGGDGCIVDLGEIIHILDQFSRRLDTIDTSINTVAEIALISAIVGLKVADDRAVHNADLAILYNSCLITDVHKTVTLADVVRLEKHHLESLSYLVGFGNKSKRKERLQKIMSFIDVQSMYIMERELQALCFVEGPVIGGVVQQAIFKKTSETPLRFFRGGCTQSKDEDNRPCEKKKELSSLKNPLSQSL
ncbi:hypothetical protein BN59_00726 [Legionella massiliensis]|uniref:Uncharacterized protein n=1 Tax=Legionella massiliensis TaxID=1034943 RepID=A0A078KU19_9GAMM|nr:hypothetical protein [Legionella massiliensis]CDZ76457.1 hypothetical protein BN59_00726 [Legionella massiliensis]CEE12195.1 hypothetical protein BN1094_00726 [Legionella massiliensis]